MSETADVDPDVVETVESAAVSLEELSDLDDKQREELAALMETLGHDEAAELVSPTRRGVLKTGALLGGALGAGGLLGARATGRARAGNEQTGTWGAPDNPQDAYLEDVYDHNDNNPMSFPGDGSVNIDVITNKHLQPVGWTGKYAATVDPANHSDDSAALQNLNDDLVANMPSNGSEAIVTIPPVKPDGSRWSFPSTVTFGDADAANTVLPRGIGFGRQGGRITTTIDDGSPVFELVGNPSAGAATKTQNWAGGFYFHGPNDAEAIRLRGMLGLKLRNIGLYAMAENADASGGVESDGAVVLSSSCFGNLIDGLYWYGGNGDATIIGHDDPAGSPPGFNKIGGATVVSGDHSAAVSDNGHGVKRLRVGGHYEGHTGASLLDFSAGSLFVSDDFEAGNIGTRTIDFDGALLNIASGSHLGSPDTEVIQIGPNVSAFKIPSYTRAIKSLTQDISIDSSFTGSNQPSLLPPLESLQDGVTNPDASGNIRATGRGLLVETSNLTVSGGGTATSGTFGKQVNPHVYYRITTNQREVSWRVGTDGSGNQQIIFEEHSGGSADVSYIIYDAKAIPN